MAVLPREGDDLLEGGAVAVDAARGGGAGDAGAEGFDGAHEEGLDHGDVADDDGDEGFADGPAAGLLGAVGAGLVGDVRRGNGLV